MAPKVIALSAIPSRATTLCFETAGILGELNVKLGAKVDAFDLASFYGTLGGMPAVPAHPARLLYDFLQIQSAVKPFTLAALRSEPYKAALSKAINTRANAFYAKYANAPDIINKINEFYSPAIADSKPVRLEELSSLATSQMTLLRDAYLHDKRFEVVRHTKSHLYAQTTTTDESDTHGRSDQATLARAVGGGHVGAPPQDATWNSLTAPGDMISNMTQAMESSLQESNSLGSSTEKQTIYNTDYAYRVPFLENFAQYHRAQISLLDEKFSQFMYAQNIPYLAAIFTNELSSMDSDVFRTQIAYLNTILTAPIGGTVTGVFKQPGEYVASGEPVLRIDDLSRINLMGSIAFSGHISLGSNVSVSTDLYGDAAEPKTLNGVVAAIRGRSADDQWELVMECDNLDGAGKPILPPYYSFDYDDTTVLIS